VLIGALLAFDAYEHDGHYRTAVWEQTKHQAGEIEHTVENWLANPKHWPKLSRSWLQHRFRPFPN